MFFDKIRQRFQLCGVRTEPDGEFLVMKCLGCGVELSYDWLLKRPDQEWIGDFSKRMKQNLLTNRAHKKCRPVIQERRKNALQTNNTTVTTALAPTPSTIIQQIAPNIQQNIVIVNLPAVTRTGSTGDPLMCSDIPHPDAKTVKRLLDDPESAISHILNRYESKQLVSDWRLRLRAERGPSPQELVKQASLAARLQDLDIIRLEAGIERREPAQWDELRVWDPGDG